ncbi:MAG: hypothetical protein HYR67_07920 [Bacteroidetes bacterium]|nr:hypothetical protein [Bacteroidota bacterium]
MKKIIPIILFGFIANKATAQNEGTLTFMNSLPQVVYSNPAIVPKYKFSFGLPGSSIAAFYSNNGFAYKDVYKRVEDTVKADLPKLYNAMKPKNYVTQALQIDLFRLGMRINPKLYITLTSTAKVYNRLMMPKDLMAIFVNGNSAFVGRTATLSPKAESVTFLETALGGSYQIDNRLTVGARIKLLKGITNVTTKNATVNLAVDNNYGLTASADMDVRTSGINNFTQSGFDFGSSFKNYFSNNGLAVDLGATYRVQERITVGASLIDIGSIHWKNNTYGYSLDPSKANYTFAGIDLSKVINGDDNYLKSLSDTLQNKFKPTEGAIGSYSAPIPGKMYLSGMYQMKRNFTAGAVFFSEKFRGRYSAGLTLGANKHFGRIFSAAASYTVASNSFNNLGAGMSLNLAPVQIYIVGDNLLSIALAGKELNTFVNNTKFFNVRLGLNFVFGWDRKKKEEKEKNADESKRNLEPARDEDGGIRRKMYRNYTPDKKKKKY